MICSILSEFSIDFLLRQHDTDRTLCSLKYTTWQFMLTQIAHRYFMGFWTEKCIVSFLLKRNCNQAWKLKTVFFHVIVDCVQLVDFPFQINCRKIKFFSIYSILQVQLKYPLYIPAFITQYCISNWLRSKHLKGHIFIHIPFNLLDQQTVHWFQLLNGAWKAIFWYRSDCSKDFCNLLTSNQLFNQCK